MEPADSDAPKLVTWHLGQPLTIDVEATYAGHSPAPYNLTDYLGTLRRNWWLMVIVLVAGIAGGYLFDRSLPREYVSTAKVLVQPAGQDTNVSGGRTRGEINLDTEAQILRSTAVVDGVAKILARTDVDTLGLNVAVEVPANTSVLEIKFTASRPEHAQAGARAFAQAYLKNREENAKEILAAQTNAVRDKIRGLTNDLNRINARIGSLKPNSSGYATLDSQRDTTVSQLNQVTNRLNQLNTEPVSGGQIIKSASLPRKPIKPRTEINLAAGALLGLLVGAGLGALRERFDRRVRDTSDLHRDDVPVLGEVSPKATPRYDDVYAPFSEGGRAFNRLRNEVVAQLRAGEQVVVVTGASRGAAATLVAANLAAALARTGTDVVLLGAHAPDSMVDAAPLAALLGVAPIPGLSDVLGGKVSLAQASQRAARNPTLRVITAGGTASAAGLLQSQALRELVATLRANTQYLVIEAPSTATSADAQSLASLADAAILAVELRRTSRPQVQDALEQVRRVGTPFLGAVVMPKLSYHPGSAAETTQESESTVEEQPTNGHKVELHDDTVMMATLDADALTALDQSHSR